MSRFWSSFWTVSGFLLLIGWLLSLAESVFTLFSLLDFVLPQVAWWIHLICWGVVPLLGSLKFIDWRWGWKPDNAGLRQTPAAAFWLLPGLAAGVVAVVLSSLIGGQSLPTGWLELSLRGWLIALLWALVVFSSEVVFRGVVISRFQQDLAGRDRLIMALAMPLIWTFAQAILRGAIYVNPNPPTGVISLGTAAMSVFLSLLFLRTDSVWLTAGIRIPVALLGAEFAPIIDQANWISDQGLLIVFGLPAVILLVLEIMKLNNVRRPGGGQRRGPQRTIHGNTIRGPWGPH